MSSGRGKVALWAMVAMSTMGLVGAQPVFAAGKILVDLHVRQADLVLHGRSNMQDFSDGGQFEILLKPASVPVQAPMCRTQIIARMPWSDSDEPGAKAAIAAKKRLFDKFEALKAGRIKVVDVTVDAAPYGKLVSTSPRKVRLSECNVFFLTPNQ